MSRNSLNHNRTVVPQYASTADERRNATRLYGVELEISRKTYDARVSVDEDGLADAIHATGMPVSCEPDGSLYRSGCEVVTQPCTLAYHMSRMKWNWMLKTARKAGYRSHDVVDSSEVPMCGMHVHIDRRALGGNPAADEHKEAIAKLCALLTLNDRDFRKFARRTPTQYCRRISNYYPTRGMSPDELRAVSRELPVYENINSSHYDPCRYQHVNRHNRKTVELRAFRGTLNRDTVIATLQFVDNLVTACNTWTWEQVSTAHLADIADVKHYNELDQYMVARGLADTVTEVTNNRRTCYDFNAAG